MKTATLVAIFISALLVSFTGYIRLIYRFWATFSTTKGSVRGTWGLV